MLRNRPALGSASMCPKSPTFTELTPTSRVPPPCRFRNKLPPRKHLKNSCPVSPLPSPPWRASKMAEDCLRDSPEPLAALAKTNMSLLTCRSSNQSQLIPSCSAPGILHQSNTTPRFCMPPPLQQPTSCMGLSTSRKAKTMLGSGCGPKLSAS